MSDTSNPSGITETVVNNLNYVYLFGFILCIILFITAFIITSNFLGSSDVIDDYKKARRNILGTCLGGALVLYGTVMLYIFHNKDNSIYILLLIAFLSLALSYASLCICVINKN